METRLFSSTGEDQLKSMNFLAGANERPDGKEGIFVDKPGFKAFVKRLFGNSFKLGEHSVDMKSAVTYFIVKNAAGGEAKLKREVGNPETRARVKQAIKTVLKEKGNKIDAKEFGEAVNAVYHGTDFARLEKRGLELKKEAFEKPPAIGENRARYLDPAVKKSEAKVKKRKPLANLDVAGADKKDLKVSKELKSEIEAKKKQLKAEQAKAKATREARRAAAPAPQPPSAFERIRSDIKETFFEGGQPLPEIEEGKAVADFTEDFSDEGKIQDGINKSIALILQKMESANDFNSMKESGAVEELKDLRDKLFETVGKKPVNKNYHLVGKFYIDLCKACGMQPKSPPVPKRN